MNFIRLLIFGLSLISASSTNGITENQATVYEDFTTKICNFVKNLPFITLSAESIQFPNLLLLKELLVALSLGPQLVDGC